LWIEESKLIFSGYILQAKSIGDNLNLRKNKGAISVIEVGDI
jgi:hypothetical protein